MLRIACIGPPSGGGGSAGGEGSFVLEYAKSNRSKCKSCAEKICKDTVRLGKYIKSDSERFSGIIPAWHHGLCI